jgi:hypothetical protein
MIELRKKQEARISGEVVTRDGRRHTINADDGRVLIADSATPYNRGARVSVVAGVIVGAAGAAPIIKNYQQ